MTKKEKQKHLPGMEDRKLPDLHALELMKKYGVEIKVVHEAEPVKVKIRKEKKGEE